MDEINPARKLCGIKYKPVITWLVRAVRKQGYRFTEEVKYLHGQIGMFRYSYYN